MWRKTLVIKCAKCDKTIFRYVKIGKGNIWHCWKKRIIEDHSVRNKKMVECTCGNIIGVEKTKYIKMKQHHFKIT